MNANSDPDAALDPERPGEGDAPLLGAEEEPVFVPRKGRTVWTHQAADPGAAPPTEAGDPGVTADPTPRTHPESDPKFSRLPGKGNFGPYEILEEIGRGGMGVVYKAYHRGLKRAVALKVLIAGEDASPEAIERFHREAESVAKLGHHPNIVPVYDRGREGNLHYFAMHFVEGRSLERMIDEGEITPKRAALLLRKMAAALHHGHEHGVLHRDVKPANILVASDGEPQVTDFGLAKDVASESRMTRSGVSLGTPQYMPPEQADGRLDDVDERSDVYGLGATFYEMLTGVAPFEGNTAVEVIHKVLMKEPHPPRRLNPAVDRDLETICLKCLEKDPERRYRSADALARDLERYLAGHAILARPVSLLERMVRRGRRNVALVATAGAALVLLAGGAVAGGVWISHSERAKTRETDRAGRAERGREKAEADRARAERNLEKNRKVAAVLLGAFGQLGPLQRDLKKSYFDTSRSLAEKRAAFEAVRETIDSFCARVDGDASSQAAMLAVQGWLLRLGGFEEEGAAHLRRAREADAEVVWGHLFEAMTELSAYLSETRMPSVIATPKGLEIRPHPGETPSQAARWERFAVLLEAVEAAPVWGAEEGQSLMEFLPAMAGIRKGDAAAAEKALTVWADAWQMAWMKEEILLARGKSRFLQRDYAGAVKDLMEYVHLCPNSLPAYHSLTVTVVTQGIGEQAQGLDPVPSFRQGSALAEQALALVPGDPVPLADRGLALTCWADAQVRTGADGRERFLEAIRCYSEALRRAPEPDTFASRGGAWFGLAQARSDRGEDPAEAFERALADLDEALRESPDPAADFEKRASVYCAYGTAMRDRGAPNEPLFRKSIADAAEALRRDPESFSALLVRAGARTGLGHTLESEGKDSADAYRRAIADTEEAQRLDPAGGPQAVSYRAAARLSLGDLLALRGEDPTETYAAAVREFESCRRDLPGDRWIPLGLATALVAWSDWDISHGMDPGDRLERALKACASVLDRNPAAANAHSLRGTVLMQQLAIPGGEREARRGLILAAIGAFDEALRWNPGHLRTRNARGVAQLFLAEHLAAAGQDASAARRRALEDLDAVLARMPDDVKALSNRATVYKQFADLDLARGADPTESLEKALADLDRALARTPDHALVLFNRGNTHLALAEWRTATTGDGSREENLAYADFRRVLELDPGYWNVHVAVGGMLERTGRHEEARNAFEEALRVAGGRNAEIERRIEALRQRFARPPWVEEMQRGGDLLMQGGLEAARAAFESALEQAKGAGAYGEDGAAPLLFTAHLRLARVYGRALGIVAGSGAGANPLSVKDEGVMTARAVENLRRALELGWPDLDYIKRKSDFDALRAVPDFQALLKEWEGKAGK